MGELTQCNYCSLQNTKARARKENKIVTLLPDSFGMGGQREYVHPKRVDIKALTPRQRRKYKGAWYMEVGKSCAC